MSDEIDIGDNNIGLPANVTPPETFQQGGIFDCIELPDDVMNHSDVHRFTQEARMMLIRENQHDPKFMKEVLGDTSHYAIQMMKAEAHNKASESLEEQAKAVVELALRSKDTVVVLENPEAPGASIPVLELGERNFVPGELDDGVCIVDLGDIASDNEEKDEDKKP